jgi:hypothetical protein
MFSKLEYPVFLYNKQVWGPERWSTIQCKKLKIFKDRKFTFFRAQETQCFQKTESSASSEQEGIQIRIPFVLPLKQGSRTLKSTDLDCTDNMQKI